MAISTLTILAAALIAQAPAARILAVDPARSTLGYDIVHKLHKVHGASKAVEAKVALSADGSALVMVRAPIKTFLSGEANRDEHMQEVLETQKYPYVVFKGTAKLALPEAFPATLDVAVEGQLDFHGRKRELKVPLKVEFRSADAAHVKGEFNVSLDEYQVERPSLLFIKIDDACRIGLDLELKAEGK
jgi:polyisoprenoid-binding protein YceI